MGRRSDKSRFPYRDGCRDWRAVWGELLQRAYVGELGLLDNSIVQAGYVGPRIPSLEVLARNLSLPMAFLQAIIRRDKRLSEVTAGVPERAQIRPDIVALVKIAFSGGDPELDELIQAVGYKTESPCLCRTEKELADHLGLSERTIQRYVAEGMPVKRTGDELQYDARDHTWWLLEKGMPTA